MAGCDHTGPFPPTDYAPTQPLNAPPLIRITVNPGRDRTPAWLPGGEMIFSAERGDRVDRDHCFAIAPGSGGAIRRYACRTSAPNDSIDAFEEAAPAFDGSGRIAFVRAGSNRIPFVPVTPGVQGLVVAPVADPNAARVVRTLPYFAPSDRTHWGISDINWLDSTRLVYVGEDVSYPRGCPTCAPDTVRAGLEIVTLDIGPATPVLTIVNGTTAAQSVAVGASSDTLYFTRNGEGVVYRLALSSGVVDTAYDFGAGRLARDVAWAAGRLFVVVDGQPDIGGDLHIVDPATGRDTVPPPPAAGVDTVWFQRPVPSPDGRRIVAQGHAVTFLPTGGVIVTSSLDIWLYALP